MTSIFRSEVRFTLARVASAAACVSVASVVACGDSSPKALTSGPPATNTSNDCGSPISLAVGQVATDLSGTTVCINGSASAAEYALIPFNGSTTSASATFTVAATGTSSPSASPTVIATSGATFDVLGTSATSAASRRSDEFEAGLRSRERAMLPRQFTAARAWLRSRGGSHASFDVIPTTVAVGDQLRLNANADSACSAPNYRTGRVVAITNRAIVVADAGNPTGGYSDAEYASFGTAFDTLIDPLDRQNFGDPTDIDGNGRMLLFFTKTVNDLTPPNSGSFIGGYFFARDLFPVAPTAGVSGCATSNVGEMFYVMVPDPVRGGAFSKANVATEVFATLAHEYQHLINASRRLYVNTASTDFEETWLDEGLAHMAEELLFYRVSGLEPRQNINTATIQRLSALVDAFNEYQSENIARYESYLRTPSAYSPYADNDSLPTRGATWAFLRYAADHRGTSDGNTWFQLVNSTTTGMANLRNVFGSGVLGEIRDWGASVLTDDIAGVDVAYQQQSWNYRSVLGTLLSTSVFPLANVSLTSTPRTVILVPGANAYLRFSVPAGGVPAIQWTGAPTSVQFTLVRTK